MPTKIEEKTRHTSDKISVLTYMCVVCGDDKFYILKGTRSNEPTAPDSWETKTL